MKTNTAERIPTDAETLAAARQQREAARQAIANATDKAARVGALHARLQAAQARIAELTQAHAEALSVWAAEGALGAPPAADAKALRDAHAELAGAHQQSDAAGLAVKAAEGERLELLAAYPATQQGVTDAAVPIAHAEILACRAANHAAAAAAEIADARHRTLVGIVTRLGQHSAPARQVLRELAQLREAEAAKGRAEQDAAITAACESAQRYWESLIGG